MSLIIEKLKVQKMMENRDEHDLTVEKLLDDVYFAMNTGRIHPKARVIFKAFMNTMFNCEKCHHHNHKEHISFIPKSMVDWDLSKFEELVIFVWKQDGTESRGEYLNDILSGCRCSNCGVKIKENDNIYQPYTGKIQRCENCMRK